MIPIHWLWPELWERRRYDRSASIVCFLFVVFLILIGLWFLLLSWIGTSFVFVIISVILLPMIFILGFGIFRVLRADRRRRAALRAQSYRRDQYPARYPFSGKRLDRDSDQEEIASLQARIAELEEQLATVKQQRSSMVSEIPEVVEVVEIGDSEKALETKTDALQKEQQLLHEELKAEKAAIDVLLSALEEAIERGAISEDEYLRKQTKYQKELKRIDKQIQSLRL